MLYLSVVKIRLSSEHDTKELGQKLGRLLRGGEVIELIGDIGAGKTTFTKGIARGMGISETIQSPTFTISRVYTTPGDITLAHYDFYRLADAGIMADELHEVSNDKNSVVIIEWGDVVREVLPADYLEIHFIADDETTRELTIVGHGTESAYLVKELVA